MALQSDLEQAQPAKTCMAIPPDDQMIMHRDAQRLGDIDDILRHLDVCRGGRGISRGVIMHQYTRRLIRVVFQWFAKL